MKALLLSLLLLTISVQLQAQNWEWQYGAPNSFFNPASVKAFDENTIVAITAPGEFIKTTDGGNSWSVKKISAPHTVTWPTNSQNLLYFYDINNGWISGSHGEILHTTDGGLTWETQHTGVMTSITSIEFFDASTGFASTGDGNEGALLKTTDGGTTLTKLPIPRYGGTLLPRISQTSIHILPSIPSWSFRQLPMFGHPLPQRKDCSCTLPIRIPA